MWPEGRETGMSPIALITPTRSRTAGRSESNTMRQLWHSCRAPSRGNRTALDCQDRFPLVPAAPVRRVSAEELLERAEEALWLFPRQQVPGADLVEVGAGDRARERSRVRDRNDAVIAEADHLRARGDRGHLGGEIDAEIELDLAHGAA